MISPSALIDPWDQTENRQKRKAKGLTGQKSHGLLTKQGLTTVQRMTIEPTAAKHRTDGKDRAESREAQKLRGACAEKKEETVRAEWPQVERRPDDGRMDHNKPGITESGPSRRKRCTRPNGNGGDATRRRPTGMRNGGDA